MLKYIHDAGIEEVRGRIQSAGIPGPGAPAFFAGLCRFQNVQEKIV